MIEIPKDIIKQIAVYVRDADTNESLLRKNIKYFSAFVPTYYKLSIRIEVKHEARICADLYIKHPPNGKISINVPLQEQEIFLQSQDKQTLIPFRDLLNNGRICFSDGDDNAGLRFEIEETELRRIIYHQSQKEEEAAAFNRESILLLTMMLEKKSRECYYINEEIKFSTLDIHVEQGYLKVDNRLEFNLSYGGISVKAWVNLFCKIYDKDFRDNGIYLSGTTKYIVIDREEREVYYHSWIGYMGHRGAAMIYLLSRHYFDAAHNEKTRMYIH